MSLARVSTGALAAPRHAPPRRARGVRAATARAVASADDPAAASSSRSRRVALAGAIAAAMTLRARGALAAVDDELPPKDYSNYNSGAAGGEAQSELVARLLAKSAENKAKNDAERKNYDRQYASSIAIIKGTGYVPDDEKSRERLGITRPPECDLPFFKDSPTCAKF
jgi:hypothetical protein